MTTTIIWTIVAVTLLGLLLAVVLFLVAKKFKVEEDPRIDEVEKVMPGANCGGCGFAGCRAFAQACVNAPNLDNNFCPVGGNEVMKKVAAVLGLEVKETAWKSKKRLPWSQSCAATVPVRTVPRPMSMTVTGHARSWLHSTPGIRAVHTDVSVAGTAWPPASSGPSRWTLRPGFLSLTKRNVRDAVHARRPALRRSSSCATKGLRAAGYSSHALIWKRAPQPARPARQPA